MHFGLEDLGFRQKKKKKIWGSHLQAKIEEKYKMMKIPFSLFLETVTIRGILSLKIPFSLSCFFF